MAEGKRGGFHSLEKKIHDLEEQDRTAERKTGGEGQGRKREAKTEGTQAERRPPSAHDE